MSARAKSHVAVITSVCGVRVPAAISPESIEDLAAALSASAAGGQAVCIAGSGSKLEVGAAPDRLDLMINSGGLTKLIEYNPHDLVIRAQAGLPFARLQEVAAENGQWLALDPPEPTATIGGIVAANASGPRRHRYGTVRDLLVGATFVLADGTVAHTGGKVVKNVAGYDLDKLLTGSYGTLAALAELTFRLHPRPATTLAVRTELTSIADGARLTAAHRGSLVEPTALELVLELPAQHGELIALFEGDEQVVRSQAAAAVELAASLALPATMGEGDFGADLVAHPWSDGEPGLRIAYPPAALAQILDAAVAVFDRGATIRARAGIGVLEVAPAGKFTATELVESVQRLRTSTVDHGATVIVVSAAPELKHGLDVWGPAPGLQLMRAIKDQFDPAHRLSPGRFVGGI
jgi:glycolate oxidase FAD binding subunit